MLVQADTLIESSDRIHRPGHLRFFDHLVTEVGSHLHPLPGEEVLKLPGMTLAPGFINLHAHLELAPLGGRLQPGKEFSDWLRQVVSHLPELTPEKRRASVLTSSRQALRSGTTSILSILSDSSTLAGLASTATRTWWALEFMDLYGSTEPEKLLDRAKAWLLRHPSACWHLALSPHSPYTASPELYGALAEMSVREKLPFTTHLAESPDETLFLQGQNSPLHALLPANLSRKDTQERNQTPFGWCATQQALPSFAILAHGNEVQELDLVYLKEKQACIVHCPTAHRWFGRPPFPYTKYQSAEIPVCLGTDSPAGSPNAHFDLREEACDFLHHHPTTGARAAWNMLTTVPAQALQLGSKLGCLAPGAWADWVAWCVPSDKDPIEAVLQDRQSAEWTCVGGVLTHHERL